MVDVVGTQLLALLDARPATGDAAAGSSALMEGHSWLEEAGGDDGGADVGAPASLPSLAAALPVVAALPAAQPSVAAAAGLQPPAPAPAEERAVTAGGASATQPLADNAEQQPAAGLVLPPRPAIASIGTQAGDEQPSEATLAAQLQVAPQAARREPADGDLSEEAFKRLEEKLNAFATVQIGLAVLAVPAFLLWVWLNRR